MAEDRVTSGELAAMSVATGLSWYIDQRVRAAFPPLSRVYPTQGDAAWLAWQRFRTGKNPVSWSPHVPKYPYLLGPTRPIVAPIHAVARTLVLAPTTGLFVAAATLTAITALRYVFQSDEAEAGRKAQASAAGGRIDARAGRRRLSAEENARIVSRASRDIVERMNARRAAENLPHRRKKDGAIVYGTDAQIRAWNNR